MIALSMIISGNETKQTIKRCLDSVKDYVNHMYIVITTDDKYNLQEFIKKNYQNTTIKIKTDFQIQVNKKMIKWFKNYFKFKPEFKVKDKIFLFDEARNYSLKLVDKKYKYIFWLDADDELLGGKNLDRLEKLADKNNLGAIFLNYIYQADLDDDGNIKNVIIEHLRERLILNDGSYKWVAPIHETLICDKNHKQMDSKLVEVLHHITEKEKIDNIKRNITNLEYSIYQSKGKDPRPVYYLGKAYFDLIDLHKKQRSRYLDKSETLFLTYLNGSPEENFANKSGWAEERAQCYEYLLNVYVKKKDYDTAIEFGFKGLQESFKFPNTYISIAIAYALKEDWEAAIHWVKLATTVKEPKTTLVNNPKDLSIKSMEVIYNASIHLHKLDQAFEAAKKLVNLDPDNKVFVDRLKFTSNLIQERGITDAVVKLATHYKKTNQTELLKPLSVAIPREYYNNPFMQDVIKRANPARTHDNNEVTIYCGPGFTHWSPRSLVDNPKNSFIGGSEEAVIYLSKELATLGWKVTVYADPDSDEGEYNGVFYRPYYKFNRADSFNILVAWRNPKLFEYDFDSKANYVWCHDVANQLDYTKDILKNITKIIVLSKYHRSNLADIPDKKIMISANGVNL